MIWKRICSIGFCFVAVFLAVLPVQAMQETVQVRLQVVKQVTGDAPPADEIYTFELEPVDGAPMPESSTITIAGEGVGNFPPVTYTEPEDYCYTIHEVAGNTEGYTYDGRVYDVTVQVTTDDYGELSAVVYAFEQGSSQKAEKILFINQYQLADKEKSGTAPEAGNDQKVKKSPVSESKTSADRLSKTGDTTDIPFWATVNGLALLALIILFIFTIKKENK